MKIKFRGKRIDNGEWVYGYYTVYKCPEYGTIDHEIHDEHDIHDVDPKTVGQYTGVNDKNGVEIYDGDKTYDGDSLGVVRYRYATWEVYDPNNPVCFDRLDECYEQEEVIGNIHYNPEITND